MKPREKTLVVPTLEYPPDPPLPTGREFNVTTIHDLTPEERAEAEVFKPSGSAPKWRWRQI